MATLTVSRINTYIKSLIEGDNNLKTIFVTGEISNFKRQYSGHLYFSLKDAESEIKAVMWRSAAAKLKFLPEDGAKVIIKGRIALYEVKGYYQIICDDIIPDGEGALSIAFNRLKKRLEDEGLFSERHKKPIPRFPQKIGVATAKTGAAIRDIFSILNRRFPLSEIVFAPVAVQGVDAPFEVSRAIKDFNKYSDCDVLIIGRGGGSIEDLWAFNEEIVARAIFESEIPIISAVGHETDFTIADFVADLRAPTPSAAAELCVPDWRDLSYTIDSIVERCQTEINSKLEAHSFELSNINQLIKALNPISDIASKNEKLTSLINSSKSAVLNIIERNSNNLENLILKIDGNSPLSILKKGYAMAFSENGTSIKSASEATDCEKIKIKFIDGVLNCTVNNHEQ